MDTRAGADAQDGASSLREAFQEAHVAPSDRASLAAILARRLEAGGAPEECLAELLVDHGHWRLYERGRQGDADAAAAFERHWRRYVKAFCGKRVTADESAELTSRFFERVYARVPSQFRWQCPFRSYLRQVLLNLWRDLVREDTRRRRHEGRSGGNATAPMSARLAAPGPSPERELLDAEQAARVRAALRALEPGDRQLLGRCFVDGEPGLEVARDLGITPDAVYQRLHRAKVRLRRLLADVLDRRSSP